MDVSVVIATYNRGNLLTSLLQQYEKILMVTKYEFEIIFSDDGSIDNSVELLENYRGPINIKVLKNNHLGAAGARNSAIEYCEGKIAIFTGDDIFPDNNFINGHYENYLKNGDDIGVLGQLKWPKDMDITYLMYHITDVGFEQFSFPNLKPYEEVDFRHFYTSNISISLKKIRELDKLFDTTFDKYGFEDIELGYRLSKIGFKILYDPTIVGFHYHLYEKVSKFCSRQQSAGEMYITFFGLHPDVDEHIKIGVDDIKKALYETLKSIEESFTSRSLNYIINIFVKFLEFFSECNEYLINKLNFNVLKKHHSLIMTRLFKFYFYKGIFIRILKTDPQYKKYIHILIYKFFKGGYLQFFHSETDNFTELNSKKIYLMQRKKINYSYTLDFENKKRSDFFIRIDPYNGYCSINIKTLKSNNKNSLKFETNGVMKRNNEIFFLNTIDPIIFIKDEFQENDTITIDYSIKYYNLKNISHNFFIKIKNRIRSK